jgi:hypothetical protein
MFWDSWVRRFRKPKTQFFITGIRLKPLSGYRCKEYQDYIIALKGGDLDTPRVDKRTFGFFGTYKEAEKIVRDNEADICEGGSFKWMVIEELRSVLYVHRATSQTFFEFVGKWEDKGYYAKIGSIPEELLNASSAYFEYNMFCEIG